MHDDAEQRRRANTYLRGGYGGLVGFELTASGCRALAAVPSMMAAFAGVVRKRLGLDLRSEKADRDRVYRIVPSGGAGSGSRRSRRRAA